MTLLVPFFCVAVFLSVRWPEKELLSGCAGDIINRIWQLAAPSVRLPITGHTALANHSLAPYY